MSPHVLFGRFASFGAHDSSCVHRQGHPPAIHLNKTILDKYREEMKKYCYDPTKYKTYLDQLGIKYPTVRQ